MWVASARLAQSVERKALNLVVVGSSPTVGVFWALISNLPRHTKLWLLRWRAVDPMKNAWIRKSAYKRGRGNVDGRARRLSAGTPRAASKGAVRQRLCMQARSRG